MRHGVVLGAVALCFIAARHAQVYVAAPASFMMYGAVHASTLLAALREHPPSWQMLVFVVAAGVLSLASAELGMHALHLLGGTPGQSGARLVLSLAALVGALGYAALIRVFWMPHLTGRSIAGIGVLCVLATLATSLLGISVIGGGGVAIAVSWWCAMSAGLCHVDRVRR